MIQSAKTDLDIQDMVIIGTMFLVYISYFYNPSHKRQTFTHTALVAANLVRAVADHVLATADLGLAAADHAAGAAVSALARAHVGAELVLLHVVVGAEHALQRRPAVRVHPPPLGARVLEPDLK